MGNRKWAMGNGKSEVGNGQWEIGSGQWAVGNGEQRSLGLPVVEIGHKGLENQIKFSKSFTGFTFLGGLSLSPNFYSACLFLVFIQGYFL